MVNSEKTMSRAASSTDQNLIVATIQIKLTKTKQLEIENTHNLGDLLKMYAVEVNNILRTLYLYI